MAPQNPQYPDKRYDGMSVEEFISVLPLTEAQKVTLRRLRSEGKLY